MLSQNLALIGCCRCQLPRRHQHGSPLFLVRLYTGSCDDDDDGDNEDNNNDNDNDEDDYGDDDDDDDESLSRLEAAAPDGPGGGALHWDSLLQLLFLPAGLPFLFLSFYSILSSSSGSLLSCGGAPTPPLLS